MGQKARISANCADSGRSLPFWKVINRVCCSKEKLYLAGRAVLVCSACLVNSKIVLSNRFLSSRRLTLEYSIGLKVPRALARYALTFSVSALAVAIFCLLG